MRLGWRWTAGYVNKRASFESEPIGPVIDANDANEPPRSDRPFWIAHLSDPHLTSLDQAPWRALLNKRLLGYLSWVRRRRVLHDRDVLARVVADVAARGFDQIAVTGDLTHVGLPQECRAAADWLGALGPEEHVALVPGNHDPYVAAAWEETVGVWSGYLSGDDGASGRDMFPTLRVRGDVALIGVDTAVPSSPLFATGTVGQDQRERLVRLLRDTGRRGLFRLLMLHHSPLPDGHRWRKRLTDAEALMEVIGQGGAELVVHGHGHKRRIDRVAAGPAETWVVAAPSASLIGDGAAGYNGYRIESSGSNWQVSVTQFQHLQGKLDARDTQNWVIPRPPAD